MSKKLKVGNELVATESWVLSLEGGQRIINIQKDAQNRANITMRGNAWYKIDPSATSIVVTGNAQVTDKVITTKIAVAPGDNVPLATGWLTAGNNTILRWQYSEPVIDSNAHVYIISLVLVSPATSTEACIVLANIESIILAGTSTEQQITLTGLVPSDYRVITDKGQRIVTVNPSTDTAAVRHEVAYYIDAKSLTSLNLSNVFSVPAIQSGSDFEYSVTAKIWIDCGSTAPSVTWNSSWKWIDGVNENLPPSLLPNRLNCFTVKRDKRGIIISLDYVHS